MHRIDDSPLGKPSLYRDLYDPGLLYPVPRATLRLELGIAAEPPFTGYDLWNAYELSWLDGKGKPRIALASFVVPADSPNIVESKSFKLYLNSYNQTRISGVTDVHAMLERDLSAAFGVAVSVSLRGPEQWRGEMPAVWDGACIDDLDIEMDGYHPDPASLRAEGPVVDEVLFSHLLKSNCPITGQPDWASIRVDYRGPRIDREGLLRYIVSFRQHGGFHEHCVERIFMDLLSRCRPERLAVYARYTRRGGLDINPFRSTGPAAVPVNERLPRQ